MAKLFAVLVATVALFAGAQAACPPAGQYCGFSIIGTCVDAGQLPGGAQDPWAAVWELDSTGKVTKLVQDCKVAPNRICVAGGVRPGRPNAFCSPN